jgi:hypothetical protein
MSDRLLSEYETMMNVGLGAQALWAFASAYHGGKRANQDPLTIWHLVTVLPLVFHGVSRKTIQRKRIASGFRSILERDPDYELAQNEVVFDFTRRVRAMQSRTMRSLNCAVSWGMLTIENGAFLPSRVFKRPGPSGEVKSILAAAEKLGVWAGQMGTFEYLTVLGVEITP